MSTNSTLQSTPVIACDMNAIPADQREQHGETAVRMLGAVLEVRAVTNGFALGLPLDTVMLHTVADYIANERLCCPFFDFNLSIEAGARQLWLTLSGGQGVKEFLQAELGDYVKLPA
jgi:hypothetical protein